MENLFNTNTKQLNQQGKLINTNSFKQMSETMINSEAMLQEKMENVAFVPNTYNDLLMQRSFQNLKVNEANFNEMDFLQKQWNQLNFNNDGVTNAMKIENVEGNLRTENGMETGFNYGFNNMGFGGTQLHPSLIEFNKQLENENKVENVENTNEDIVENKADEIYKDIINVMETHGEYDDRLKNSEFLKFIKRLKTGEIKLNEKDNDIIVNSLKNQSNIEAEAEAEGEGEVKEHNDEEYMDDIWNKLGEEMSKQGNMNFDVTQRADFRLADNPFILDSKLATSKLGIDQNLSSDLVELSKTLINNNDTINARLAIEAETQQNPDNSEAWILLGKIHCDNDRDDFAMECFLKAIEADPYNAEAYLYLGISCTNEFDEFEAMNYLKEWVRMHHIYNQYIDTKNPLLDTEMIRFEMYNDRPDEDYYQKAKRIEQLKQNFYFEMLNVLETVAKENPEDKNLFFALGIGHFIPHENERAIECFRRAVEIDPTDYSALNKLGAILAHSKINDAAISTYKKALEIKPDYARCWANLGIAYLNLNLFDECVHALLTALKINPNIPHVWAYMNSALIAAKQTEYSPLVYSRNLDELLKIFKI